MSEWLEKYRTSHQHPTNRLCHTFGIPMIVVAIPVMMISWRWSLGLFVVGWILQFVGHWFEGKLPAFFSDVRFLFVGPLWWLKKLWRSSPEKK